MPYYICIADCTPNNQDYYEARNITELRQIVRDACKAFDEELDAYWPWPDSAHKYAFKDPYGTHENNWSQRVRIARNSDRVLDVIGMTMADYREQQL